MLRDNDEFETQYDCPTCPGPRQWRNPTGGQFDAPGNWTPSVPQANHDVLFNLGATYTLPGRGMTFSASLLNALQSIGLEEGNPRSLVGVGGNYFFARPILPRRLQAGIRYNF